jgi:2,3-bisphosphoglycerate-independent phosphoglycerate mutase
MPTSTLSLHQHPKNPHKSQRVLVVVLDGVGVLDTNTNLSAALLNGQESLPAGSFTAGNAVNAAWMPNLALALASPLSRTLRAHGPAVGLPSEEDMGNSEVGHNALGAGRVFDQGAKLVNRALESGELFAGDTWKWLISSAEIQGGKSALHLMGLFSDGNVHSHINHLFALIEGAKKHGVKRVRLHLLADGRDVPPTSALDYVEKLDAFLKTQNDAGFDCRVASGGGRMFVTMDRYESDWSIVERGYKAHVLGEGKAFPSMREAIETLRKDGNFVDQNLPAFVIAENGKPIGTINDGDSVVLFNFRGDRAIQISRALTEQTFKPFERKRFPNIKYAGMMQYDGDLKLPEHFLVTPPSIARSMSELLSATQVAQFACSETQKYGHVTYFWNGNRSGKFNEKLETYVEVPSDRVSFSERPWMKCAEIADETIQQMHAGTFQVGRINFANGDMVGHTGDFQAAYVSNVAVDLQLGRLMQAAKETNTVLLITADHGNADEMYERDKKSGKVAKDASGKPKAKTSHTLSPVPFAIYNAEALGAEIALNTNLPKAGLSNVAATVLELAGFQAPEDYDASLIVWGSEKKN